MKIIMFKSPTCAPCKMMAPYITRAVEAYPSIEFEICDVAADTTGKATKYRVGGFPTLMAFNELDTMIGVVREPMTETKFKEWVESL